MPTSSPGRLWRGDSPPVEQEQGDLWVSQTDNNLYRHDGQNFKSIAPASASGTAVPDTVTVQAADYAASPWDLVLVNATGAQRTITLPTAVGNGGKRITCVKTDASANAMVVATTGGQTISGQASLTVTVQWTAVQLESDGSNWVIT